MDLAVVQTAYANARARLLALRDAQGAWRGRLSSSALSTATAITALAMVDGARGSDTHGELVRGGVRWLAEHQNPDGGWGDTDRSLSNISTTTLVWSALAAAKADDEHPESRRRAEAWLVQHAGGLAAEKLAPTIAARYGDDRTFSVPILTMAVLCGRLPATAWKLIPALPFELAAFPQGFFRFLRLPVVSYALPALIAMGLAHHRRAPAWNPLARAVRAIVAPRTLRVLEDIQPESGGFLEATPLTSFVTMTLVAAGEAKLGVVDRAVEFLVRSAREDGSWPIDTDLATWLTTLTVNGLGGDVADKEHTKAYLLGQQYRVRHPYTGAAPGGWAWTDLSGGVPDADDTAGAVLALAATRPDGAGEDAHATKAAMAGLQWLMDLQNADGGIPTFCRGWGRLEFDRSAPDLTAHALRAALAWWDVVPPEVAAKLGTFINRLLGYLDVNQREDGSWLPLWLGNQYTTPEQNAVYGTARVLRALEDCQHQMPPDAGIRRLYRRGVQWLLETQHQNGGWGGTKDAEASVEETAWAVDALASGLLEHAQATGPRVRAALESGTRWLLAATRGGTEFRAAPIGFYFAKLWYYEDLYPVIFAAAAWERITTEAQRHRERTETS